MNIAISLDEVWLSLPILILFLGSLGLLTIKAFSHNMEKPEFVTMTMALIVILVAAGVSLVTWMGFVGREAFQGALVFDGLGSWSVMVILFITAMTLIFSRNNPAIAGKQYTEHVFLTLNSAVGMIALIWSNDLIITFIAMELMSLTLYVLIGISHEDKFAKEAAFKYFILGSLASAIFLFGIALVYGGAGSVNMTVLAEQGPALIATNRIFLFGVIMVLAGVFFKISMFPFHAWTPDVYQGSPTPITGFMATGVKLAMFVVLLRLTVTKGVSGATATLVAFQWVAVLTMLIGNLGAIRQQNFKRMLAYSSIAHSGYAFVGVIAVGVSATSALSASSVLYYLCIYAIMNLGAFGLVSMMEKSENSSIAIDDLKGLAARRPWMAFFLSVLMLSLAGIPPTAGFFGKFYIFSSAVTEGLYWITVWGVINSVISVYYYLRPIVNMYMYESDDLSVEPSHDWLGSFAIGLTAVLVIGIGLCSGPFYKAMFESVRSLFGV